MELSAQLESLDNLTNQESNKELIKEILSNNPNSEEKELSIFLYTIFQFYLEKAIKLYNSKELDSKFKAFKIIESLIQNSYIDYIKSNIVIYTSLNGLLNYFLATCNQLINQQILEQDLPNDLVNSEKYYLKSLDYFSTLDNKIKIRFVNYFQETYNNLGIIYFNRGEPDKGLQYFAKAEQIYLAFNQYKGPSLCSIYDEYIKSCTEENTKYKAQKTIFGFFIDGGIDITLLEKNYTQTLFYYAQSYAKLDFKKKGIYFCCMTLKRQVDTDNYDLKDAIINCINLSEFFVESENFAQAEYLLLAGLSLLPEDLKRKKKLRARVQMQLGKVYLERLKFAQQQVKDQVWISDNEQLFNKVNKRVCVFSKINVAWPKVIDIRNKEDAKCLFRLGNTQLTRALEYFLIDGYVTEHTLISRNLSALYKALIYFEDDIQRVFLMLERRIKILELIFNAITKEHFIVQWQELTLELAEIHAEYFEKKFEELRQSIKGIPTSTCKLGMKSIEYYDNLLKFIDTEVKKQDDSERSLEDFTTFITIQLSVARLFGKLNPNNDFKAFKINLVNSLKIYQDTEKRLKESKFTKGNYALEEQLMICQEMVSLLPVKIDQM